MWSRGKARNFCFRGGSCSTNIFIKTTPTHSHTYIHTHTHTFLLYIHIYKHAFLFDKLYICTHPTNKKKYFQSKLCLMAIFHKIKFIFTIFIVKFLKNFIFNISYQIVKKSFSWTNEIFKNMNNSKLGGIS